MSKEQEDRGILECIERAEERAQGDDREFVRLLNECYAQSTSASRLRGIPIAAVDRSPKVEQLLKDPRYLKNARELARRTQGRTRVIGGIPVVKNDFLDCVAVGTCDLWTCTGTLIAPNVVITAAHCGRSVTQVFFGNDVTRGGKTVSIEDWCVHPDYTTVGHRNDLMVLLLSETIRNIAPRAIAEKATVDNATDGRVVGFGNNDPRGESGYGIKRQVDIAIASPSCSGMLDGISDADRYRCFAGLEFVAGKPLLAKDSCTGDSGGPFYVQGPNGWLLAGATSRQTNASTHTCGDGGIYVRVERYLPWIRQLKGVKLP